MLIEQVLPQVIGEKATLQDRLLAEGDENGLSKAVSQEIISTIPQKLLNSECFLDRLTSLWRYEFGTPYLIGKNELLFGTYMWHPDRLARNSVDGGLIIYLLDTGKLISLKFPTFWFENTPQGKFMLNIAFGQSKYYVDNLRENVLRGIRQKLRRGEYPGKPPIGYLNESRLRTIVIDEAKASFVRKMFEEFSIGQHTFASIRELATASGLRTWHGNTLAMSQIPEIFRNPFYVGMFYYDGELNYMRVHIRL